MKTRLFFVIKTNKRSLFFYIFSLLQNTFFPMNGQIWYPMHVEWSRSYLQLIAYIGFNLSIIVVLVKNIQQATLVEKNCCNDLTK